MAYILNSPVFTGNPQAPTPLTADNSTSLATTAFVKAQGYGAGTVTAIGVTAANGVSGSSSGGATPNLTLTLGTITPTSVNGLTISTTVGTLTIANTAGASLVTSGGGYAINLAANGATNDPYGPISVTNPGTANNYTYYGLTRNGLMGMGMGWLSYPDNLNLNLFSVMAVLVLLVSIVLAWKTSVIINDIYDFQVLTLGD